MSSKNIKWYFSNPKILACIHGLLALLFGPVLLQGPSSSGREDPQSVSTSRQRARKTPGVPVTADGTPKDTKKKGARARKRRQVPRVAQVDPSAPIQSSAKFETLVKGTTTCQQLMGLVEKRPALKPSEVVLVCNQLSKVCDPQKMTVRAWSEVQVGRVFVHCMGGARCASGHRSHSNVVDHSRGAALLLPPQS